MIACHPSSVLPVRCLQVGVLASARARPGNRSSSRPPAPRRSLADARDRFLSGADPEPDFTYRELTVDPDVADAALEKIDVNSVEDATLDHLLRAKHREMKLQVEMLRARGTDDFRQLSVELYGGGVLVVNDPASLATAQSKAHFQHFPEAVRPHTLISRNVEPGGQKR